MKTLAFILVALVFVELLVAVAITHWFHRHIFNARSDLGAAMRQLSVESPRSSLVVKLMYSVMLLELGVAIAAKVVTGS